jgi:hypothetical protein
MTTKISILEKKIEVLNEQAQSIRKEKYEVQEKFEKDLTDTFKKYFRGIVSEDINVKCSSSSIFFYKRRGEDSFDTEIFSIYLRESYSLQDIADKYKNIELSYYTTSTNSDFELERLEALGKVAYVVRKCKKEILEKANALAEVYSAIIKAEQFYKKEDELGVQIRGFRGEIRNIKREERKKALFSEEGLVFEVPTLIQLKYNYTPRVTNIKLVDVSKSGKKATAVFTFAHHSVGSREENVSVEKVLEQIL